MGKRKRRRKKAMRRVSAFLAGMVVQVASDVLYRGVDLLADKLKQEKPKRGRKQDENGRADSAAS